MKFGAASSFALTAVAEGAGYRALARRAAKASVAAGIAITVAVGGALPAGAQGIPLIRDTEIEDLLNDYARPIFKAAGLSKPY